MDDTAGAPNDAVSPSVDAVGAGSSDEPFSEDGEPVAVVDKYRLGPNNFVPFPGPSSDFAAGGAVAVAAVEFTTVDGTVEAAVDGAASVDGAVDGAAAVDGTAAVEAAGAAAGVMLCLATTELYCCISITAASSNTCTQSRYTGGP